MTNPTPTSPWLNMRFLNHVLYLICLLYLAPSSVLIITRDVLPKTVSRQCLLKGECFNPIASVAASDCVSITKNKHGTKYMQIFSNIRQTGNLFPSTLLKQTLSNQIVFVADSDGVRNEASKHESISRQKRPEPRYKMSHIRRGCFCLALVLAFFPPFPYCCLSVCLLASWSLSLSLHTDISRSTPVSSHRVHEYNLDSWYDTRHFWCFFVLYDCESWTLHKNNREFKHLNTTPLESGERIWFLMLSSRRPYNTCSGLRKEMVMMMNL